MVQSILAALFVFSISLQSSAKEILFEGYYKITSAEKHIGFSLIRYEFDNAQKKFYSTSLTKISSSGLEVMESLSAIAEADDFMTPVSYKYTGLVGKESKLFEVTFKKGKTAKDKNKMTVVKIINDGKPQTIRTDIESDVFLSTFLSYRMLRSKTGIQTQSQFKYQAVAEEDAKVESGTAKVLNEEKYKGFSAFKIENTFKSGLFVSHVTDKGEALATNVPDAKLTSELVAKPADAIGTIGLPENIVKSLFGKMPIADKNVVTQYFNTQEKSGAAPGKTQGVPAGQGIMISPKEAKSLKEGP